MIPTKRTHFSHQLPIHSRPQSEFACYEGFGIVHVNVGFITLQKL